MPRPPIDHFRFIAPLYDHVFGGDSENYQTRQFLDLPIEGWLLDAGGGTGRVSQHYVGQAAGVVVLDVSLGMLQQAREKGGLQPALGAVETLPFPDGFFERILIVDAFHHFFAHQAAVRELWRVLQPGGRLLIVEPNIARFPVKLIALGEALLLMRSRFFSAQALGALFADYADARVHIDTDTNPFYIHLSAEKHAGRT